MRLARLLRAGGAIGIAALSGRSAGRADVIVIGASAPILAFGAFGQWGDLARGLSETRFCSDGGEAAFDARRAKGTIRT